MIIFEMILHLDWSPPLVNSVDWTFPKAHTYTRFHSWQCISELTKPWGWRNWKHSWSLQKWLFFASKGLFCKLKSGLSCVFHSGEASVWPLCHEAQIGGVLRWGLSFWRFLPSPHRISGAQLVTIGFLVTSLTKALLPQLLSLARRPALGRVLVVPNPLSELWRPLGNLQCSRKGFCSLPQICASTQSCLWALQAVPSTSRLGFCSDVHRQLWDLI